MCKRIVATWFVLLPLALAVPLLAISQDDEQPHEVVTAQADKNRYLFSTSNLATELATTVIAEKHVTRFRSVNLVTSQFQSLSASTPNDRLVLNLFDDAVFVAILDRVKRNATGSTSWIGHLENIKNSSVLLVARENSLVAKIAYPSAVYEIGQMPNGFSIIKQVDQSTLIEHSGEVPEINEPPLDNSMLDVLPQQDTLADDGSVIDVMVVYSPEARAATGGILAMESTIEMAVAEANIAYEFSGADQRLILTHMYETPDSESGNIYTDLPRLRGTGDGFMDEVHSLRNTYHADFVQLITNTGGCGLGYLQSTISSGFQSSAFAVSTAQCVSAQPTFPHELGHNMGLRHDWYADSATSPYTHAHGFTNPADRWRTIMAYNAHCAALGISCTPLGYFSNLANTFDGDPMGVTTGTASNCVANTLTPNPNSCDADNVSVLNVAASNNASFRSSAIIWQGFSTDWNDSTNWIMNEGVSGSTTAINRVPRLIDDVVIPTLPVGGQNPTISNGTHNVRHVLIRPGATLNMSGGILNVHGSWEEQDSNGTFNSTGGTVVFSGVHGLDQTIEVNSTSTFNNLTIGDSNSTQAVSLVSDMQVNGNMTIGGSAAFSADTHTITVKGNWDDQANGFLPESSTVIMNGGAQTILELTTPALIDESFAIADGHSGFSAGYLPFAWTREHISGRGFTGGDLTPWGGNGGGALCWGDTTDGWLHTSGITLEAGTSYQLEYKYRTLFNGATHDFSVSVGTAANSASMTSLVSSVTNAGNSVFITQQDTFTVPSNGVYYLGFRAQQNVGAGYAAIDDIKLDGLARLSFHNLEVNSSISATLNSDLVVRNNLTVNAGGTLDLSTFDAAVDGIVVNNGTLKQTKDAPSAVTTEFLRIKNTAANADKYFGIEITPAGNMGNSSVSISGNQACPKLLNTVRRCYEITPTTSQTAVSRFYYQSTESNGQVAPKVYHYNGTTWDDLGVSAAGGSGDGLYSESTTTEYSPFVLADSEPTYVTIGSISLDYLTFDELLEVFGLTQEQERGFLLSLLANWDQSQATKLADSELTRIYEALTKLIDPDGDGKVAIVRWDTLQEVGTIGFYLERSDKGNADWTMINNDLLPGLITAPMGGEYLLIDPDANTDTEYLYRLIELDAHGSTHTYGPFPLEIH